MSITGIFQFKVRIRNTIQGTWVPAIWLLSQRTGIQIHVYACCGHVYYVYSDKVTPTKQWLWTSACLPRIKSQNKIGSLSWRSLLHSSLRLSSSARKNLQSLGYHKTVNGTTIVQSISICTSAKWKISSCVLHSHVREGSVKPPN